jgi:hypothetical protein
MTDYYELPPPEKKKRSLAWLYLLLLLLFLLGLWATWWSLRLQPGEIGEEPLLTATAMPAAPLVQVEPPLPEPVLEPEAVSDAAPEDPVLEPAAEAAPEPEPPAPLFSDVRWRETARFTGTDAAGRSADFTAYVLVGDETWSFARADAIFAAGLSEPVETAFDKLELGAGICDLTRVIAVGAASVEGTSERNTFLSHTRGHAMRAAIGTNLPCEAGALPTSVLDLGYSRTKVSCPENEAVCPELSAPQRPIAMILADADDPETDIAAALQSGIAAHEATGADVLPGVKVSDYSAFDLR